MDLNLPGEDGLALTRDMRASHPVGVIMLQRPARRSTVSSAWKWARTTTFPSR